MAKSFKQNKSSKGYRSRRPASMRRVTYGQTRGLQRMPYRVSIRRPSSYQRLGPGRYGRFPLLQTHASAARTLQNAYRTYRRRGTLRVKYTRGSRIK